jgi:hypothetical protein
LTSGFTYPPSSFFPLLYFFPLLSFFLRPFSLLPFASFAFSADFLPAFSFASLLAVLDFGGDFCG